MTGTCQPFNAKHYLCTSYRQAFHLPDSQIWICLLQLAYGFDHVGTHGGVNLITECWFWVKVKEPQRPIGYRKNSCIGGNAPLEYGRPYIMFGMEYKS